MRIFISLKQIDCWQSRGAFKGVKWQPWMLPLTIKQSTWQPYCINVLNEVFRIRPRSIAWCYISWCILSMVASTFLPCLSVDDGVTLMLFPALSLSFLLSSHSIKALSEHQAMVTDWQLCGENKIIWQLPNHKKNISHYSATNQSPSN